MKRFLLVIAVIVFVLGGWLFASPWLAMKSLADAAEARDTAELEAAIDFTALRANARMQLDDAVGTTGNPALDRIGGAVMGSVADAALDAMLTPDGVAAMITTGAIAASLVPQDRRGQQLDWQVRHEGLSRFRGVSSYEDGTPGPLLLFERRGLGWKLVDISLAG